MEFTQTLELEPKSFHQAGENRKTPTGDTLPGRNHDTRWRYSVEHNAEDQYFVAQIDALIAQLEPHKAFLNQISATGGSATIIVQFLGDDGYFGDSLPRSMLTKMGDLGLDFGIEVYTVPQITS